MRVIHLSTSSVGGAGIAAFRLHQGLLDEGVESLFLQVVSSSKANSVETFNLTRNFWEKIFGKTSTLFSLIFSKKTYFTFYSTSLNSLRETIFSFPKSDTIIHVHNWFNMTNLVFLNQLKAQGYQLVFTLHDMRLMTGGCHASLGCNRFISDCYICPNLPRLIDRIPRFTYKSQHELEELYSSSVFICPSKWILSQAQSSSLLSKSKLVNVYNYLGQVDLQRNLPRSDVFTVGTASMSTDSYFKGDDLIRHLEEFALNQEHSLRILRMATFSQTAEGREEFWSEVDALLVPSRADNSPNVIHEAKMRGIPVIGSAVGGIPELLNDYSDCLIPVDQLEASSIIDIVMGYKHKAFSQEVRMKIQRDYLILVDQPLKKMIAFYDSLIRL
jgi:glycosyltransferase involved in cell wall biosynthesis